MSNPLVNKSRSDFFKKFSWIAMGGFVVLTMAYAIVNTNWLYLGVLLFLPLLIYIFFRIPFLFFFGLYAFLLPFDSLLLLGGATAQQSLTKYLAILTVLVLFLKGIFEENFRRPDTTVLWLVLLSFYSMLTLVWAIDPQVSSNVVRNVALLPIFYLVVSSYKVNGKDYETLKWCIIAGGFVTAILSIYSYDTLLQSGAIIKRVSVMIGDRASSLNGLAFNLLLPVAICTGIIFQAKSRVKKTLLVIVLGSILFCIILTGSRGGMLGAGVIFSVFFLLSRKKMTYLTFIIPIIILIISLAPSFLFDRWESALETGGSGRTAIWYVGLKALQKYWVAGAGIYNFPAAYTEFAHYAPRFVGLDRAPHNIFIGMFVELGIIGLSLMITIFVTHYKAIDKAFTFRKYDIDSIMLKAAFWSLLASSFFLDTFWHKSLWLLWMLILIRKNALDYDRLPLQIVRNVRIAEV